MPTIRASTTPVSVLVLTLASLGAGLTACAVGPSTRVEPPAYPVVARTDSAMSPAAQAFLDSLGKARAAGTEPSGNVVTRPDSARRADTTARALPVPRTIDTTHELAWLDVLADSQLVALVDSAVANNRDLRTAEARVREFRALYGVARSGLFPQLTANGAASTNKVAFGPTVVKFDAVRITGDLAWELDFWGRLRRQAQAGNFDLLATQEDARATALTLVSDVATAYLQLRELDADLAIAQQTLASRQATLALARQRFAQGLISELDVRQFEAEVADPAARVAQFALQRDQQENALSLLLGQPSGAIPRGRPLEEVIQAVAVPDSIPGDLITRRPDVMRAQRDLQAAVARVGVAMASRLPTITLSGSFGAQHPNLGTLFTPQGEIYTLQAGVSLPLFTGGRLRDQQRAAQSRADEARAQYEQTVLGALREASDALASVRLDRDQLVAQETQTRALGIAASIAERRYASGVSSYLEVLDAQRSLFTAQLSLVQAEQQYLAATVQLFRALGGSWTGMAAAH